MAECAGFENRLTERLREFESPLLRFSIVFPNLTNSRHRLTGQARDFGAFGVPSDGGRVVSDSGYTPAPSATANRPYPARPDK